MPRLARIATGPSSREECRRLTQEIGVGPMIVPRGPFWWRIGSGVLVLATLAAVAGWAWLHHRDPALRGAWNLGLCRARLGPGRGPGTSVGEVGTRGSRSDPSPGPLDGPARPRRPGQRALFPVGIRCLAAGDLSCWDVGSTVPARRTRPAASGKRPCDSSPTTPRRSSSSSSATRRRIGLTDAALLAERLASQPGWELRGELNLGACGPN